MADEQETFVLRPGRARGGPRATLTMQLLMLLMGLIAVLRACSAFLMEKGEFDPIHRNSSVPDFGRHR